MIGNGSGIIKLLDDGTYDSGLGGASRSSQVEARGREAGGDQQRKCCWVAAWALKALASSCRLVWPPGAYEGKCSPLKNFADK